MKQRDEGARGARSGQPVGAVRRTWNRIVAILSGLFLALDVLEFVVFALPVIAVIFAFVFTLASS